MQLIVLKSGIILKVMKILFEFLDLHYSTILPFAILLFPVLLLLLPCGAPTERIERGAVMYLFSIFGFRNYHFAHYCITWHHI